MVSTHYGGEVELLRSHYKGLPNDESLVAFVDESYRLPGEAKPGESPFYTMTAVLLRRKDLLGTREDLTRIADGDYWHTVEFAQRGRARQDRRHARLSGQLQGHMRYLGAQFSWNGR